MADLRQISAGLDADILLTHERFVTVMEARVGEIPLETKERYFAVLSLLVGKLEDSEKRLPQILQEMMVESATIIMAELQK